MSSGDGKRDRALAFAFKGGLPAYAGRTDGRSCHWLGCVRAGSVVAVAKGSTVDQVASGFLVRDASDV